MSGKRYPNLSMVEYQEIWRNHKSVEEEAACGFFDRFRKDPTDKKDDPLNPGAADEKDKKSATGDKDLYPPIVTIDGRVDTDIDHLIEDLADEYKGPVDDIPSKFPKPHVFSVIEGSLDDDVDSYANDDGTMEHTLVDTPKSFNPKDLKDVASKDGPRTPGHSKAGQMEASHTDRSHNKMNVDQLDNDGGHQSSGNEVPSGYLQTEACHRWGTDHSCSQDAKDGGHKTVARRDEMKQIALGSSRKRGNGDSILMQKSSSCLEDNRGHSAMNLMKSESADGHNGVHRYKTLDTDADQALTSRTVVLTQCDSSAHTTEVREASVRVKDTESAVGLQAYTESLTCTFTDESFREGHASLETRRPDPDHSQSLSETETVSDMRLTSTSRRPGQVEMCEDYDYDLDNKVGSDFEHRLYHFPSYSDDSLTKSSELYPKSRYMAQSTSHLNPQVEPGTRQPRPSSDPANGADGACTRKKHQSSGPPVYPHTVHPENTSVETAYPKSSPGGTTYPENTYVHTGSIRRYSSKEHHRFDHAQPRVSEPNHRFDHAQLRVSEPNHSAMEDKITRVMCQREARVNNTSAREQKNLAHSVLEESHGRLRDKEGPPAGMDPRGEFDPSKCPRSSSHSVGVGTPKEYRTTSTQNEMPCDDSVSLSRDLGIQVTFEACEKQDAEINRGMTQPQKGKTQDPAGRNGRANDLGTVERPRKLHIQVDQLTRDMSDTESLDSEANYLLRQLQMAQMTKRKANSLLRHVQSILEETETVGEKPVATRREMDEGRCAARAEAERGKHSTNKDHNRKESHLERSPHTHSICATRVGDQRSTVRELEVNKSPATELLPPCPGHMEAADRGLVQTLVNNWDKQHRAVSQGKADFGCQTRQTSGNRWPKRPASERRDSCDHIHKSDGHQCRARATCDGQHPATQATKLIGYTEQSLEKRGQTHEFQMAEKRERGHSFERSHRLQKHMKTEPIPGPMTASTHIANDSTSLASVSMDSVSVNKQVAGKQSDSSRQTDGNVVDKRTTPLPRKVRHKRRTSPDLCSRKDALRSKWRHDIDAKRIKARSSSIKDSLRAAFKVAEESMTAAARVAEALNIVMKASLISPPSSSSVEDNLARSHGREVNKSPVMRSKRLNHATANCRSKLKPSPALSRSPGDASLRSDQPPASRHKVRKLDNITERSEQKKRLSHSHSTSQDRSLGHKTSLSSPLRGDTFSRKPTSGRASSPQLDTQIAECKEVHSKSSITVTNISPQACGDSTAVSKKVADHTQATSDQPVIVHVAYTETPELALAQPWPGDSKVQIKEAPKLHHDCEIPDTLVGFSSSELPLRANEGDQKGNLAIDATLSKSCCGNKKHEPELECEVSSKLSLSKEEWTVPSATCSTGRKGDSYFTHKPPIIDQNLHSLSLSAKQIIRRQLVGSCVDPGCTDSTCSESVESNSNFNRSAAGRQLHLNMARKREQQQRDTRMNKVMTSKCREEMELTQSADPFFIWQCDASLQYQSQSYPSDTNVFLQPDRGKPSSITRCENDISLPAYRCISRSHQESNTSRRATVHVQDTLRTSYQLHEEEILQIDDYFESSCTNQETWPCVATLCYTDLSSPVTDCFGLPQYGSIRTDLADQAETRATAQVDISPKIEFDRKYNLSRHEEVDQMYDVSQYTEFDWKHAMSHHNEVDQKHDMSHHEEVDPKYGLSQSMEFDWKYDMSHNEEGDLKHDLSHSEKVDQKYDMMLLEKVDRKSDMFKFEDFDQVYLSHYEKVDQKNDLSQQEEFDYKCDKSQKEEFDHKCNMSQQEECDYKCDMSQNDTFDRKSGISQHEEVDRKYPIQRIRPGDVHQFLGEGDTFECPRDPPRGQSGPAPKPRARKLYASDSDSFPLPGRNAQITKFSPIIEEMWLEDFAQSKHRPDQTWSEFPDLVNNSISNNSSNKNNSTSNKNNSISNKNNSISNKNNSNSNKNNSNSNKNSRSSGNIKQTNHTVNVDTRTNLQLDPGALVTPQGDTRTNLQLDPGALVTPQGDTRTNLQLDPGALVTPQGDTRTNLQLDPGALVTPQGDTRTNLQLDPGALVTPQGDTSTSSAAHPTCMHLCASEQLSHTDSLKSLTRPFLSSKVRRRSIGLGCADDRHLQLRHITDGVHSAARVRKLQTSVV